MFQRDVEMSECEQKDRRAGEMRDREKSHTQENEAGGAKPSTIQPALLLYLSSCHSLIFFNQSWLKGCFCCGGGGECLVCGSAGYCKKHVLFPSASLIGLQKGNVPLHGYRKTSCFVSKHISADGV